ncbi:MAG: 50S ribosomal protein L11 methyltransferase [Holosporaceae bacterium]|jgi:ribosomal protein L11 methyltransferase|nr:50S ribosomal protein L11 methyltransferase [Holosporaceae bacterium]
MTKKIFKCTIGDFNIKDAFESVDVLFENGYESVSCAEKGDCWIVEVLHDRELSELEVRDVLSNYKISKIKSEEVKETNWLQKCFENFRAIFVGNFYIYGPHLRSSPMPTDKIAIEIAAATAFGTGEHPTTNRCLIACQTFFDEKQHKSVLDIGCGSCILSIALAKLGARNVFACDCDSESVRVSKANTKINRVAHKINVFQNSGCEFNRQKYDFIVSNILSEPLISMKNAIVDSLAPCGILVLSGFRSDDDSVLRAYVASELKLKFRYDHNGWTTLVFEKNNPVRKKSVFIDDAQVFE